MPEWPASEQAASDQPVSSLPTPPLADPNLPVPSLNSAWDEDELMRAAKSLAQFFNGEVVPPETEIVEAIAPLPGNDVLPSIPPRERLSSGISSLDISSPDVLSPNSPEPGFLPEEDDDVPF